MKKVLLSVMFVGIAAIANAQKSEVAEAKKQWNIFQISSSGMPFDKTMTSLNEGLKHTDLAIANEKSKVMPEAWSYRALFASAIAVTDSVDNANAAAKFKIAQEAIAQATTLDTKGEEKSNIENAKLNLRNSQNGRAVRAYKKADYAGAYAMFNEIIAAFPNDTSMYINAGVTAKLLKKYPEAIGHFKKVIAFNVPDAKNYYSETIQIALNDMKDTTTTLALTKEALAKYPDDPDFVGVETDIYITRGDIAKSQELLTRLIAKDPKKPLYHHLFGDSYFKQALALQAVRDKIDQKKVKEFDAVSTKMMALVDQSIPYYKKAVEVDPKYAPALETLAKIYAFKGDTKTYEEYNNRLKALPAN